MVSVMPVFQSATENAARTVSSDAPMLSAQIFTHSASFALSAI